MLSFGKNLQSYEPTHTSHIFSVIFLAQVVIPLLLIGDLITAWRVNQSLWWYGFGTTGQVVFLCSLVWITSVFSLYILGRYTNLVPLSKLKGPLVSLYSVVFSLVIIEVSLQISTDSKPEPALWPLGKQALLAPDPNLIPGINGPSSFTGNSLGLRGPEIPEPTDDRRVYKIITVGGSTTESLYLDDTEEWPHLIMKTLNAKQNGVEVWVGNGGQSGRNTVDHLELIRHLPVLGDSDLLIFLIGLNDLQPTLALKGAATQDILTRNAKEFGLQILRGGGYKRPYFPILKRTELFNRTKVSSIAAVANLTPYPVLNQLGVGPGTYVQIRRNMRAESSIVSLPSLEVGLHEYRTRIQALSGECQYIGIRCIFLTQPSMWRHDLSEEEKDLMWFGWVGREFAPLGYLSISDAAMAMDIYNDELLGMCTRISLECFDLASVIPKTKFSFYDDAHFNEGGARLVAYFIAKYLISMPPFAEDSMK